MKKYLMAEIAFVLCLLLILLMTGCQSARDVHEKAKKMETKAHGEVEYVSPDGDTLFSDVHQFWMSSPDLDTPFKVYIDDWRGKSGGPEYLDTYLSIKYREQGEQQLLQDLCGMDPEAFFGGNVCIESSTLALQLFPIGEDLGFEDWYEQMEDGIVLRLFVVGGSNNYRELAENLYKRLYKDILLRIMWLPEGMDTEQYDPFDGYFLAEVFIDRDGLQWREFDDGYLVDEYVFQTEEQLLTRIQRNEEWQEIADEIKEVGFGDVEPVEMPDPDVLQSALVHGNEFLENTNFDHLVGTID